MTIKKPKLSLDEQIEHLKDKGILFNIMDESDSKKYLEQNNNYFKLTAYRKNYNKHPDGKNKGKYINLEFAYLVDMAIIDMRLRYQIVHMALDIEHHAKLQLLRKLDEYDEDGYQIVQDYINSLTERQKKIYDGEIERCRRSIYCSGIIEKYDDAYPVWAFVEIITLGRFVDFYGFCARRFADRDMKKDYFNLLTCKKLRNASAHSNCIFNDLKAKTTVNMTSDLVTVDLMNIKGMNANYRKNRMSNVRIQQIVTLLYMHKTMVVSEGIQKAAGEELRRLIERISKHRGYYLSNPMITGTFNFLEIVVDNWFKTA